MKTISLSNFIMLPTLGKNQSHLLGISFTLGLFLAGYELIQYLGYPDQTRKESEQKEKESPILQDISNVIRQAFTDAEVPVSIDLSAITFPSIEFVPKNEFSVTDIDSNKIYFVNEPKHDQSGDYNYWKFYYRNYKKEVDKRYVRFSVNEEFYRGELTDKIKHHVQDQLLKGWSLDADGPMGLAVAKSIFNGVVCSVYVNIPQVPLSEVYAIAAHEAMHAKRNHMFIGVISNAAAFYGSYSLSRSLFNSLPLLFKVPLTFTGTLLTYYLYSKFVASQLNKIKERDADFCAAERLLVANELSSTFTPFLFLGKSSTALSRITANHPSELERLRYLRPYVGAQSLFFKSKANLEITARKDAMQEPAGPIVTDIFYKNR